MTFIGTNAFAANQLTSVIIGSGVTHIEEEAFYSNPDLNSICIEAPETQVTADWGGYPNSISITYDTDGDCTN